MLAAQIPDYALRFRVKPGITGLAQVTGFRGETSTAEAIASRIALDLRYIDGWTLSMDLRILFQTLRAVLLPRNAY